MIIINFNTYTHISKKKKKKRGKKNERI